MHCPVSRARRRTTRRAIAVLSGAAAALSAAAAAPAASTTGPSAIIDALNAQRAANGIPARVRENAAWSASCAHHAAYMAATKRLTHVEDPSTSGYTERGSWAGQNSVLAAGPNLLDGDVFQDAPLHLIQLLSPELHEVGVAEASGFLCVTTWPGYRPTNPRRPTVYTYPGAGAVDVPPAETSTERPFSQTVFAGLRPARATGFGIMAFVEGIADLSHTHIVSAALTGPGGRVAVRTIDRTTPTVGPYLPPGSGFVIPLAPLRPGTTYRATVRFAGGPRHTWIFTTAHA
jgi:hypothetical protein